MKYLILPTEPAALARSQLAFTTDTAQKRGLSVTDRALRATLDGMVTQYRWATDVGLDGQTALLIDGDEQLLTAEEQAAMVDELPDGPGENWEKPSDALPSPPEPLPDPDWDAILGRKTDA